MHYYSHNIGDYRRDTAHLSILEHGAYRQLLDSYYLAEKPLTPVHADLMRTHCARSADEMQAVVNVLRDFFVLTDDGYIHKRCDIEIEAFHSKSTSASESAKARWSRVRAEKDADAMRTHSEGNALQTPDTRHQTPEEKKAPRAARTASPKKSAIPDDFTVSDRVRDWAASNGHGQLTRHLEHFRSACKAKGYTYVDWDEAFMGAIRKDWAGLNAPQARASPNAKPSPAEQRVAFMAELTGRSPQQSTSEVIDVEFRSTAPRLG